jgi:tetratricopeptide (TPR) repeat protein
MALALALPVASGCTSTSNKLPSQQTSLDKMTASVKNGTSKMIAAVTPKPEPKHPPMESPSGKPGPAVFVAAAQMHESSGNFSEAEANYRKALDIDANYVDALIGYARLEDRQGNFDAATKFYQRAIKKHPKNASVRNDLGLCYHRHNRLSDATRELKKAVELDGDNKLYRNNLAAAYVEQGKYKEATAQLVTAHGKSVGNYNMGYLLTQRKDNAAALRYFQAAAEADPKLIAAQEWIGRLADQGPSYASYAAGPGAAPSNAAYVAQNPGQPGAPAQYSPQAPVVSLGSPQQSAPMPPMPR